MIYLLFVMSTLLAVWSGYNKDKLTREGRRIPAAFVSSALPFLISFCVRGRRDYREHDLLGRSGFNTLITAETGGSYSRMD